MSTVATIYVSLDGGTAAGGHVIAELGQSAQFSRAATDGARTVRYEIFGYPPDFACPSGWTEVNDVYTYSGDTPPVVTLSVWGKYLGRLRLCGASDDDATGLIDSSLGIEIYSPNGLRDTTANEEEQCGGVAASMRDNWDRIDSLGGLASQVASSTTPVSCPSGTATDLITVLPADLEPLSTIVVSIEFTVRVYGTFICISSLCWATALIVTDASGAISTCDSMGYTAFTAHGTTITAYDVTTTASTSGVTLVLTQTNSGAVTCSAIVKARIVDVTYLV